MLQACTTSLLTLTAYNLAEKTPPTDGKGSAHCSPSSSQQSSGKAPPQYSAPIAEHIQTAYYTNTFLPQLLTSVRAVTSLVAEMQGRHSSNNSLHWNAFTPLPIKHLEMHARTLLLQG